MSSLKNLKIKNHLIPSLIALVILVAMALIMQWEGRLTICECGYVKLWHGLVVSSENSQHLFDWYSLTHFLHGLVFYVLLWLIDRKKRLSVTAKLLISILGAAGWEVLENSAMVIDRYRNETISLDYYGDSIVNAIGDVFSMVLGFFFALKAKPWMSIVLFVAIEIALAYIIRDNLTINIIMLIYPIEGIKAWQQVV